MDWQQLAKKMRFDDNMAIHQIAKELGSFFPDLTWKQLYDKVQGFLKRQEAKEEHEHIKPVIENYEPEVHNVNWKGNKTVRFALVSDTHLNSKYAQITYLHDFYDKCVERGISHVYHCGDMDEGDNMRIGHIYEETCVGGDLHIEECIRLYPKRNGITTHFISGNHDASIHKKSGINIGPKISAERDDMEYLGQDCAVVHLTPNCTLELRHPWDGTAYSLSYKLQKMIEAMMGGEKPNILAVGHYHKSLYMPYRNIHAFYPGCFQMQTPFTKGKGLSVQMGGWIIEADVDESGYIQSIRQEFIPYYEGIKDDYKNWVHFKHGE